MSSYEKKNLKDQDQQEKDQDGTSQNNGSFDIQSSAITSNLSGVAGASTISTAYGSTLSSAAPSAASNLQSSTATGQSRTASSHFNQAPEIAIEEDRTQPQAGQDGKSSAARQDLTTKFRYHKRITVRTHGKKTSPSAVMAKVNEKDPRPPITMETLDKLDPNDIIQRAGLKPGQKAHWRIRLRQTKRVTKNGKTTTETKVAFRDSEGNRGIKVLAEPQCPYCHQKPENCKCEPRPSQAATTTTPAAAAITDANNIKINENNINDINNDKSKQNAPSAANK